MKSSGFTLVEVLVASLILFISIGLTVLAFNNSVKAIESSESINRLLTPVPIILSSVETALRNVPLQPHSDSGVVLGVQYVWQATPLKKLKPVRRFDPDVGDFIDSPERFALYDVELTLSFNGKQRTLTYQKFGWALRESTANERNQ